MSMSLMDKLITKYCSGGVEYKELWELTYWDKRFNGVEKEKQKKIIKYPYLLANDINALVVDNGYVRILSTGIGEIKYTTEELAGNNLCKGEIVAIPWGGTPNIKYYKGKFVTGDNRIATSKDTDILNNKFLYYYLANNIELISSFYRGAGIQHPSMKAVLSIKIPVPPLPVQEEIVKILDAYSELEAELESKLEAEIDARKKQYEYHLNQLLSFDKNDENVKFMPLGEACDIYTGGEVPDNSIRGTIPDSIHKYPIYSNGKDIYGYSSTYKIDKDAVCISSIGANTGAVFFYKKYFTPIIRLKVLVPKIENLNTRYLYYIVGTLSFVGKNNGGIPNMNANDVKKQIIPIPSIEKQERMVAILDEFNKLTNEILDSLQTEIIARKKQYEYYQNKLLTFKEIK